LYICAGESLVLPLHLYILKRRHGVLVSPDVTTALSLVLKAS